MTADDLDRVHELADAQIPSLRHGQLEYQWHHQRGTEFAVRAERALNTIEIMVLPNDPSGTSRLLE